MPCEFVLWHFRIKCCTPHISFRPKHMFLLCFEIGPNNRRQFDTCVCLHFPFQLPSHWKVANMLAWKDCVDRTDAPMNKTHQVLCWGGEARMKSLLSAISAISLILLYSSSSSSPSSISKLWFRFWGWVRMCWLSNIKRDSLPGDHLQNINTWLCFQFPFYYNGNEYNACIPGETPWCATKVTSHHLALPSIKTRWTVQETFCIFKAPQLGVTVSQPAPHTLTPLLPAPTPWVKFLWPDSEPRYICPSPGACFPRGVWCQTQQHPQERPLPWQQLHGRLQRDRQCGSSDCGGRRILCDDRTQLSWR